MNEKRTSMVKICLAVGLALSPALGFAQGTDERNAYLNVYLGNSQFGEIVSGLDGFFRDPANLQIQVTVAMEYFQEKVKGASPESLAKDLADHRKFAADHLDQ